MHAELANVEVGMEANRQMQYTLAKRQSCHLYKCNTGARACSLRRAMSGAASSLRAATAQTGKRRASAARRRRPSEQFCELSDADALSAGVTGHSQRGRFERPK
jgi:hypothetical protein